MNLGKLNNGILDIFPPIPLTEEQKTLVEIWANIAQLFKNTADALGISPPVFIFRKERMKIFFLMNQNTASFLGLSRSHIIKSCDGPDATRMAAWQIHAEIAMALAERQQKLRKLILIGPR